MNPNALAATRRDDADPMTEAQRVLHSVFGYSDFRGDQAEIISHVTGGGDALVLMPTGGGKSLCYQIPAMLRERRGTGGFAAHLPYAGSGRCAGAAWRAGGVSQFEPGCGNGAGHRT